MTKQLDYKVAVEIDIDCEELVDAVGLDYTRSEDDDTQNIIMLTLDKEDWQNFTGEIDFNDTNEQDIGATLLNHELGEYVTKVTIYKPNGDVICFY